MNKPFRILALCSVFCLLANICTSQITEPASEGGEYPMQLNDAAHPCVTAQEYETLEKGCAENIKLLGLTTTNTRSTNTTLLSWPLKAATGLNDCGYYAITAYADQNTAGGATQDWNCGTNTYDSHRGTDIAITPYPFYKLDHNEVEVIAAAAGTILYKSDGHFDKYCASNSDTANFIIIRHADGSQANYFHMKKNSLTAKTVGQTVTAGEYLGVVGSSGNSSGAHLHFEVWSGSTVATLNDPFAGNCNTINANSWWAAQKPYTEPAAIKVSVNTTDAVFPACPATETPNESNTFAVPFQGAGLAPGYAKFYLFMRNETSGMTATLSILNPNNTTFNTWTYTSATTYKTSTRSFSKLLPTTPGTYTFKSVYNGTECSTTFTITGATGITPIRNPQSEFRISPNPASNTVTITVDESMLGSLPTGQAGTATITDVTGRGIINYKLEKINTQLQTGNLANGVYLVTITGTGGSSTTEKLVVSH